MATLWQQSDLGYDVCVCVCVLWECHFDNTIRFELN